MHTRIFSEVPTSIPTHHSQQAIREPNPKSRRSNLKKKTCKRSVQSLLARCEPRVACEPRRAWVLRHAPELWKMTKWPVIALESNETPRTDSFELSDCRSPVRLPVAGIHGVQPHGADHFGKIISPDENKKKCRENSPELIMAVCRLCWDDNVYLFPKCQLVLFVSWYLHATRCISLILS